MNENALLDAKVLELDGRRGEILAGKVYSMLGRFVAYPSDHARVAHTLWILHTHLMDKWESTPRLAFLSPEPGSGKTRALEITELLVPRPVATVNVSPAYIFRKVGSDEGRPTILYDEIDTVFGPKAKENEEIRGLLNAGHRRGAVAGRCVVKGKAIETEEIPAYAAVALAGLGWLPDTILTRSVVIRMRRRKVTEQVEPYRQRIHGREGAGLRAQIETWAASQTEEIEYHNLPPEIQDRDADVWEPLLAIADLVGSDWPARARAAAVALISAGKDAEQSLGVRLLSDLRIIFDETDFLTTTQILIRLHNLDEAPWGDLDHGKPLDARGLARRLKEYGIKPEQVRQSGAIVRGYRRADLEDQWSRYLPVLPATCVTSVTPVTEPDLKPAGVTPVTAVTHLPANRGEAKPVWPPYDDDDPRWLVEGR